MKKKTFYLALLGLICWSPLMTDNLNAQRPSSAEEQNSPFPDDEPIEVNSEPAARIATREETDKQMIMINSKYAGWEEVSPDPAKRVSDSLRGNWIMVDSNGRFQGTVTPGKGAGVERMNVFLMNMGRLVKQTTLEDGKFEFTSVRQGAYSLIGWGDRGFFAFGLNILTNNPNAKDVANQVKITAYQNQTTINTDWIKHFSPRVGYRVFGRYPTGEQADDPASLYGVDGLVNHTPKSVPATSISSHAVSKTADGRLIGRVHQLNSISGRPVDVRSTRVMLLQDDDVVASTTADNFGVFEFQQVPDGSFAVAAAGVDGVGLIGITVGGSSAMNDAGEFVGDEYPIDFTLVSSETMGWLNHYAGEVSYRRALLTKRPAIAAAPAPYFGGGACPSCQNQAGGCNTCQNQYLLSLCRSRGLTFEQWQQNCQGRKLPGQLSLDNLGNGDLLVKAAGQVKKNSRKVSDAFDKAFYPDNDAQQLRELQQRMQMQSNQGMQMNSVPQYAPQMNYVPQTNYVPQMQAPQMQAPQLNAPQMNAPQMNWVPQATNIPMGDITPLPSMVPSVVVPFQ